MFPGFWPNGESGHAAEIQPLAASEDKVDLPGEYPAS